MPSNTENRTYFESVNSAYEEPIQHVYSEMKTMDNAVYENSLKSHLSTLKTRTN